MNNKFSIYDSPFSDETKRIRRNLLFAASACLFVGLSGEIPKELMLIGIGSPNKPSLVGWFMLCTASYFFFHFLSVACVEVANWIHPFYVGVLTKRKLLKHPGFDGTDWEEYHGPINDQDLNEVAGAAEKEAEWKVQNTLKYLYSMIYLKLLIEVLMPLIIGVWGLLSLLKVILAS